MMEIIIIAGFLGVGKTTLINNLVKKMEGKSKNVSSGK